MSHPTAFTRPADLASSNHPAPHQPTSVTFLLGSPLQVAEGDRVVLDSAGAFSVCIGDESIATPSHRSGHRHSLTIEGPAEAYLDTMAFTVYIR